MKSKNQNLEASSKQTMYLIYFSQNNWRVIDRFPYEIKIHSLLLWITTYQ